MKKFLDWFLETTVGRFIYHFCEGAVLLAGLYVVWFIIIFIISLFTR